MISGKKTNFIVEFRTSTIRAARISSDHAPTVVEALLEIEREPETDVSGEIRSFAGAKSNAYMHASCAVYPSNRVVRQVLLDTGRGKEAEFVLGYLRNTVGVDPDTFAAYCISSTDGTDTDLAAYNKKPILLCGAPKSEIVEVQEALVGNAIYPNRLEIGTVGIVGVLKDIVMRSGDTSPALFLEIDESGTNAVIVGLKGVEMARRIDFGSGHIASALKEEMNLKDEEAAEKILRSRDFDLGSIAPKLLRKLLRELQSSIGFFEVQTGNSVSKIYSLNQGRVLPWLEHSICDLLNLKPLDLNMSEWLASEKIDFASDELREQVDVTWLGMLSLALELGKGGSES